jgi:hypothetical protein
MTRNSSPTKVNDYGMEDGGYIPARTGSFLFTTTSTLGMWHNSMDSKDSFHRDKVKEI